MNRRGFLAGILAAAAGPRAASPPRTREDDFEALWREIDAGYAYFDDARRRAWDRLRREGSRGRGTAALESAIARLRDDSVTLRHPALASRRVPYDLDIWPRWRNGIAVVEAVRTFSDADVAGVHPGQRIVAIDGVDVERAVREPLRGAPFDENAVEWALRRVLTDKRGQSMRLDVREAGASLAIEVEPRRGAYGNAPAVIARRMASERDLGYIRVRMGPDAGVAQQFESAFGSVSRTRALILDLRESSGPCPRAVTMSILSRLALHEVTWQFRQPRRGPRIADTVVPAASPYPGPVAVLVDRWTAGEAEALAAGLKGVAEARIVGTATAGLHGEPSERTLPASGIVLRFPGERTFTADAKPREALDPDVRVDPAAPSGGPGDPILYQALKLFERR